MAQDPGSTTNPWVFFLPFASTVYVYGFTNAVFNQKIVVTLEDGSVLTMTGSGEGNQPTTPAKTTIQIPSSGSNLNGYQVEVTISYYRNGNWLPSQVTGDGCTLGIAAATYLVASEDFVDRDWNDAIVQFLWYNPPMVRNATLGARAEVRAQAQQAELASVSSIS